MPVNKITDKLKAIPRHKIYEEVANQIRALIEEGGLQAGERLPTERQLSEIFRVSRHSVREAIRTLEQEKLLVSQQGSGTFVLPEQGQSIADYLAQAIQREKDKLSQIFQFRKIIESEIAFLATENITEKVVLQLKGILKRQEQETSPDFRMKLDREFHQTLALASGNPIMLEILKRIHDILAETRKDFLDSPTRAECSLRGHYKILAAIEAKDPARAKVCMQEHLNNIKEIVLN